MSEHLPRRGFLRQLCHLPLIGGGLTLIGAPTAIAAPVTEALFRRYAAWVTREHVECLAEADRYRYPGHERLDEYIEHTRLWARGMGGFQDAATDHPAGPPSTRAALVLSAVGCDWKNQKT